jgi:hypothetical protein
MNQLVPIASSQALPALIAAAGERADPATRFRPAARIST